MDNPILVQGGYASFIDDYLITKSFDFEQLNIRHKDRMIKQFKQDKIYNNNGRGYNTLYDNDEYTTIISNAFLEIVNKTFEVSPSLNPIKTWIYAQTNNHWSSVWHNHVSTSTVNAVYYIDPPKRGGGLNLRYQGMEHIVHPKPNTLYLFPCWMEHRPLPQEDDKWRISVNIEYMCNMRPTIKGDEVIW